MKKFSKKALSVLLAITLLAGMFSCFASAKEYYDYKSYVLLGDSVASGWSDLEHRDTTFKRVEGSYGALIADDLQVETYHPMACIGFRTTELRYIFEDDYEGDRFLFYSVSKAEVDARIPAIRKAVAEADLITLNVGGNDWGSYVGWHIEEAMANIAGTENFVEKARDYLEDTKVFNTETIETLIEFADFTGVLPQVMPILPKALEEGFRNYVINWDIIIEDIYALNPDVELVVIGMFDTGVQDETMNSVETEKFDAQALMANANIGNIGQTIVNLANIPMRNGVEKYGYTFIDPVGTLCEKQHPSYAGHRHIADLVLKSLPDASFPYTDVSRDSAQFKAIQYMYTHGIMAGISETEFGADQALTASQLTEALSVITGKDSDISPEDSTAQVTYSALAKAIINNASAKSGVSRYFKAFIYGIKVLFSNIFSFSKAVTRGTAAEILMGFDKI